MDKPIPIRDLLAAAAIAGLVMRPAVKVKEPGVQENLAKYAYELADAMLKARHRPEIR